MPSIFNPTSTQNLSDLPVLVVDEINAPLTEVLVVNNKTGEIFKIPFASIGDHLSVSYTDLLTEEEEQIILGRFEDGPGPLQKIKIGDNIILNSQTGLLDSNLSIVGPAGGVLEGEFPYPSLKEKTVGIEHLQLLKERSIIGRYSEGEGPPEEITLGPEFLLDEKTGVVSIMSSDNRLIDTGFIVEHKDKDFKALPNTIFFVDGPEHLTVDASEIYDWKSGQQFIVVNNGTGEVNIGFGGPLGYIAMLEQRVECLHIMADGNGGYILL